jgi:hypothetical protein
MVWKRGGKGKGGKGKGGRKKKKPMAIPRSVALHLLVLLLEGVGKRNRYIHIYPIMLKSFKKKLKFNILIECINIFIRNMLI